MQSCGSEELELIDFRLAKPKDFEKGYGSLYICKEYKSGKIVRIVSTCANVNFKKQAYMWLFECKNELKDTIFVASDINMENKYRESPIFFGILSIPIE